jgi:hypothetical protein
VIVPNFVPADILHFAGSAEAGWNVLDTLKALPAPFREPVKSRYSRAALDGGREAAKSYIESVDRDLCRSAISLAASDAEICDYAKERANEVRSLLMAQTGAASSADLRDVLVGYCVEFGATAPAGVLLAGLVGRMTDAAWWRRQVRRNHARRVEAHAIGLGFVHRRAGLYASDDAVRRHGEQQARNRAAMQATEATNEEGLTMTLAELSAVSVSNPRLRRGELMTRIAGFESFAKAAGHVGMFYTGTAPSRMHPRLAASGQENPKFDGTTPKECAGYMSKTWAKARAWLHRRGISIYGFRVAEPHHDGTPHWHMLFFMVAEVVDSVTHCLRKYFSEADAHELKTEKAAAARFNYTRIDWKRGSAAGYISKYIAKNIDGSKNDLSSIGQAHDETEDGTFEVGEADKTAPRVLAWASTWGIRQFQQIGGPGVTVWRELRRLREMDHQGDLFDTWSAADAGNWHEFTERQGGAACRRDERPVQLWRETEEGKTNRYGEAAGAEIKGVRMGEEITITRLHTWEVRRGGDVGKVLFSVGGSAKEAVQEMPAMRGAERRNGGALLPVQGASLTLGRACGPWSPVNNCTHSEIDADGFKFGAVPGPEISPMKPAEMAERIRAAEVAAVLAGIAAKRRRGGFGQFQKLNFSGSPENRVGTGQMNNIQKTDFRVESEGA